MGPGISLLLVWVPSEEKAIFPENEYTNLIWLQLPSVGPCNIFFLVFFIFETAVYFRQEFGNVAQIFVN